MLIQDENRYLCYSVTLLLSVLTSKSGLSQGFVYKITCNDFFNGASQGLWFYCSPEISSTLKKYR